jgi:signal peptidase I
MNESVPLTDQLANISPAIVVAIVAAFTIVRVFCARFSREDWARTISEICDTVSFVFVLAFLLIRPFLAQAFYIPSESMVGTLLVGDRLIVDKVSYRFRDPERLEVLVFAAPPEATRSATLEQDYIKRLIGMPGDKIEVRGSKIKIGEQLIETTGYEWGGNDARQYLHERLNIPEDQSIKFFTDYILVNDTQKVTKEDLAKQLGRAGERVELTPGVVLINDQPLDEPYTHEDPGYNMSQKTLEPAHYFMMGDNRNRSQDSHVWGPLEKWRIVGHGVVTFWPLTRMGRLR